MAGGARGREGGARDGARAGCAHILHGCAQHGVDDGEGLVGGGAVGPVLELCGADQLREMAAVAARHVARRRGLEPHDQREQSLPRGRRADLRGARALHDAHGGRAVAAAQAPIDGRPERRRLAAVQLDGVGRVPHHITTRAVEGELRRRQVLRTGHAAAHGGLWLLQELRLQQLLLLSAQVGDGAVKHRDAQRERPRGRLQVVGLEVLEQLFEPHDSRWQAPRRTA